MSDWGKKTKTNQQLLKMNIKRMLIALHPDKFAPQQNGLKFKSAAPKCALGSLIKGPRANAAVHAAVGSFGPPPPQNRGINRRLGA